jgi:hypothetical protein
VEELGAIEIRPLVANAPGSSGSYAFSKVITAYQKEMVTGVEKTAEPVAGSRPGLLDTALEVAILKAIRPGFKNR